MRLSVLIFVLILGACSHQKSFRNPASIKTCGLNGSLENRQRDCSKLSSSSREYFVLVMRSKEAGDIWKDTLTGYFWYEPKEDKKDQGDAIEICRNFKALNLKWHLPYIEEYKEADTNGLRSGFEDADGVFWSQSFYIQDQNYSGWLYNASNGRTFGGSILGEHYVRCVGVE